MKSVSDFFSKFLKLSRDLDLEKNAIIETVKEQAKIVLSPNSISLKDAILSIQGTPLERTQIFLYKKQIQEKLSSLGIQVRNIR